MVLEERVLLGEITVLKDFAVREVLKDEMRTVRGKKLLLGECGGLRGSVYEYESK